MRAPAFPSGPTRAELAAAKRELLEARRAEAVAAEDADAADRADIVNRWRDLPAIPPWDACLAATRERPFEPSSPPPTPPDAGTMRARRERELREATRKVMFPTALVLAWLIGIAAVVGVSVLAGLGLGAAVLIAPVVAHVALARMRRDQIEARVRAALSAIWPAEWARIVDGHNARARDYGSALIAHRRAWTDAETLRAQWAARLVQGDLEALSQAISESVTDLDFPFETDCRTGVFDAAHAALLIDLPIEDVIPATRVRAMKNGTAKSVKRTKAERNGDYAALVTGLGIMLARAAFAAAPTVRTVSIAAFTQRRKRRSGVLADDYLYELSLEREVAAALASDIDPVAFVTRTASRIHLADNGELKRIDPPAWAADLAS